MLLPSTYPTRHGAIPLKVMPVQQRGLRMNVTPQGLAIMHSRDITADQILAFLAKHRRWLETQWEKRRPTTPAAAAVPFDLKVVPFQTKALPADGRDQPVVWKAGSTTSVKRDGAGWTITVPEGWSLPRQTEVARKAIVAHWQALVTADLNRDLGPVSAAIGRAPTRVIVKSVSSLWGRCTSSGEIMLDFGLALATPAARRYVWIHELCHLAEMNHSPRFWAWVEKFCPDWQKHRTWLDTHGPRIKAQAASMRQPA
jgi:predicted metal-dependent hydrolase